MIKEYLITEAEEFKVLRDRYNSKVLDEEIRNIIINTRKELDKRFIDREELKDKINKRIKKLEKGIENLVFTDRAYEQGKIVELKYILELLKE